MCGTDVIYFLASYLLSITNSFPVSHRGRWVAVNASGDWDLPDAPVPGEFITKFPVRIGMAFTVQRGTCLTGFYS
jgi:hypothetical protein